MLENKLAIILLSLDFRTEEREEGLDILESNLAEIRQK